MSNTEELAMQKAIKELRAELKKNNVRVVQKFAPYGIVATEIAKYTA